MSELQPEDIKRKNILFETIPNGQIYTTCLVRRRKSKSGKDRYYIYDSNDLLLVAAECDNYNDCFFTISLDAIDFSKSSPYIIAKLTHRRFDTYYFSEIVQNGMLQRNMTIKYLSYNQKKNKTRKFNIDFEPDFGTQEPIIQADDFDSTFKAFFPDMYGKIDKSSKNFIVQTGEGNLCFSFAKMFKDEFHLAISNPLSILDGFIIALSTFHILKNER